MTVIVGLETNDKEKAVVIGTDRLCVNGDLSVTQFLRQIEYESPHKLSSTFEFLKKYNYDKIKFKLGRKIKVSKNRNSALAHTGVDNDTNKQITKLLLNPDGFLKQDSFLIRLLFPSQFPKKIIQECLKKYRKSFDINEKLKRGHFPEIKRISDLSVVQKHEFDLQVFKIAYWDRNYNANLSEYLFARSFNFSGKLSPLLLDISLTGAINQRQYYAKGCGGEEALKYMRKELGTEKFEFFYKAETKSKKQIILKDAVDIVTGAVNFANERDDFCRGLDYVVITSEGVETHFSDEKGFYEIDLPSLIDKRIASSKKEIKQLMKIKSEYPQTN